MRHNKVLSLAIASALSLGVSTAYAGKLTVRHVTSSDGAVANNQLQPGAPTFASEYFFSGNPIVPDGQGVAANLYNGAVDGPAATGPTKPNPDVTDRFIYAIYEFESTVNEKFLAKFELSNGATLGADVRLDTTNLDFVAHPSGSHVAVTSSGAFGPSGKAGESIATFLVQPSDDTATFVSGDTLFFRFRLKDLDALQSAGEEIKMTVTIFDQTGTNQTDGPAPSETVASSARGADISLDAIATTVQIDVSQESKMFVGNIIDDTTAALGSIKVSSQAGRLKEDGSAWTFATDNPKPSSATLTISEGNFGASLSSPGQVFIDLNGDGVYSETDNDILAATLEEDFATWDLSSEDLTNIRGANGSTANIVIKADGVTEINAFKEAPQATFVLDFGGGNVDAYSSKLRHIKRNGTVCTLYNIPNPNALDTASIRVTNTSGVDGKVMGTLRATDGTNIFTNQELIATLAPFQTVRLGPPDIDAIPRDQTWLDAGGQDAGAGWPQRAVLTLSSNIQSMEVFGLVRAKTGGPLTNLSVGASGNGCE